MASKMLDRNRLNRECQRIVQRLVKVYEPQKIILFGSLASGKIKEGTDIDLFIIKEDVPRLGIERIRQLDSLVKYRLATDFIVYKPQEVQQRIKLGDPFVKKILEEGKVLYEAK